MKIAKTGFYSWKSGNLSKGCRLCVKGAKLVLFVTGLCARRCFYCPLSDQKKNKDVIFANERPVKNQKDIVEEARLCSAIGAGITGGDPLLRLSRTVKYIKLLKNNFGRDFHIHLYAPLMLITKDKLRKLYNAGLDEIRLHPDIDDSKSWDQIDLVGSFDWHVGVEIPAIPDKKAQTKRLIDYFSDKIDFLNLNELEISDTNANSLLKRGFVPKDRISYAVMGSEKLARELLKYCLTKNINTHYCTARLKDKVQVGNRIKKRAKNIAYGFDIITECGTLVRGAVYLNEMQPGFSYNKLLLNLSKSRKLHILKKLSKIKHDLIINNINPNLIKIDKLKLRLVIDPRILKKAKDILSLQNHDLKLALIEEYPTYDQMPIEIDFLQ